MRYKYFELDSRLFVCLESQYDFIGKFLEENPSSKKALLEEVMTENSKAGTKTLVVLSKHALFRKPKIVEKTDCVWDMYLYSLILELIPVPISVDGEWSGTINQISLVLKGG